MCWCLGTNVQEAKRILSESGLPITSATDLDDAAKKAVAAIAKNWMHICIHTIITVYTNQQTCGQNHRDINKQSLTHFIHTHMPFSSACWTTATHSTSLLESLGILSNFSRDNTVFESFFPSPNFSKGLKCVAVLGNVTLPGVNLFVVWKQPFP